MYIKAKLKSNYLLKQMAEKNLPRKWLVKELGTTSGYLSQLINGTRFASPEMRKKIMSAIGVKDFHVLFNHQRK